MSKGIDRATFFFSLIGVTTLIFVVRNNHQYLNETVVTLALLMFVVVQGALYWQRWINIGHKGYWSLPVIVVPIVGQFAWSLYGSTMQTIVYRELLETIGTTILVLLGALAIEVTLVWFLYGLVMQTNGNRKPLDTPGTTIVFLLGVVAISGIVSSFWASGVLPKLANGNPFS